MQFLCVGVMHLEFCVKSAIYLHHCQGTLKQLEV